ncbi:MAG: hypothetical protein KGS72_07885, partial [Cyanobacteria bacterium REEB67]|nr:hypothetical protein [Cyanobacteria bacterium REEB67]
MQINSLRQSLTTPSILRTGLLLVLVPYLVGSIFLLVLDQLWISTGELTARSQAQNENVLDLTSAFNQAAIYSYEQMTRSFDARPLSGGQGRLERDKLNASVDKLIASSGDSSENAALAKAAQGFCSIAAQVDKVSLTLEPDQFTNNMQRFASYSKILRSGTVLSEQLQDAVQKLILAQEAARQKQDAANNLLSNLIRIGFWGTAAVLIFLLVGVVRNVLSRLETLSSNARALANNEPLLPITGGDELAYLNTVFEEVAGNLQTVREHRNLIMQMVAHDIRSPIMAAQINVEILLKHYGESAGRFTVDSCRAIIGGADRVVKFVNDLLASEQDTTEDEKDQGFPSHRPASAAPAGSIWRDSLVQRALIVLLLPFVLQAFLLFFIDQRLIEVRDLENRERSQSDFVVGVNRLWLSTFVADSSTGFYLISRSPQDRVVAEQKLKDLSENIAALDSQTKGQKEIAAVWQEARDTVASEEARLRRMITTPPGEREHQDLGSLSVRFGIMERQAASLQIVQKKQMARLAALRSEQDSVLTLVSRIVYGILGTILALSLFVWLLFAAKILKRFRMLVDFAREL